MANDACSDTGPFLHLHEVSHLSLLKIFSRIFISPYIKEELSSYKLENLPKNVELKDVNKDQVALIAEKYGLDVAESSAIWLCKSMKISLFLTDDLSARDVAKEFGLKAVGTVGIIIRCFRQDLINQHKAIEILKLLHKKSSLFITSELIGYSINEIKKFRKK